jgi:hypothetical protein
MKVSEANVGRQKASPRVIARPKDAASGSKKIHMRRGQDQSNGEAPAKGRRTKEVK